MLIKVLSQKLRFVLSALLVLLGLTTFLIVPQSVSAVTQATYYASPTGSGTTCSLASPCSLTQAHTQVLAVNGNMTGDIIVYLRGGTYNLSSTFQLTESGTVHDSGTNGYNVIYQAYTGEIPVISGGQTITGWSLYDSGKNIYRANVGTSLNTRQLYVNGVRATRARGVTNPAGFTKTSTGWTAPATGTYANMSSWGNKSNIEIVSFQSWKSYRCDVSTISGSAITMQTPCWTNAQLHGGFTMDVVTWVENAYELLTTAGQWYLDRTAGYLYYIPVAGDTMTTDTVIAPTLETLVNATGAAFSTPIHNIQFKGITFAYATWLRPSTTEGYADVQATYCFTGSNPAFQTGNLTKTPGVVSFHTAQNVRLDSNTFTHLGGSGLVFEAASQNNTIIGNSITDISAGGVLIGDTTDTNKDTTDTTKQDSNNTVKDNYIYNVGVEYHDGEGITVGYTKGTIIDHNYLQSGRYTAISVGWGWGTSSYSQNNQFTNNEIFNFMTALVDGGGIYTLSPQNSGGNGSTINNNYIHDLSNINTQNWALYHDNGTQGYYDHDNVIRNTPKWVNLQGAFQPYATNNTVTYNYSDTPNADCCATSNTVNNNATDGVNTSTVVNIINNAGLESAYKYLRPSGNPANLALNKPTNAFYMDGSKATMHAWSNPGYAVDGDTTTAAEAYGQYRWQQQVDLTIDIPIYRVRVTMPTDTYATQFNITVSRDGTNFTTVKSVTGFSGGISDQTFNTVNARYVRIVAVKPDGAGQQGGEMCISELEVYAPNSSPGSVNLALGKTATMDTANNAGQGPAQSIDGNMASFAQSTSNIPWSLTVDLGSDTTFNQAVYRSDLGTYATSYTIDVATAAAPTTWTTVNTQTTNDGNDKTLNFTAVTGRYVKLHVITAVGGGPTWGHAVRELEIYNRTNKSLGKTATMDTANNAGQGPAQAIDGNMASFAQSTSNIPWSLTVDLGSDTTFYQVVYRPDSGNYATSYTIDVATAANPTTWTTVATQTSNDGQDKTHIFVPVTGRYVKLHVITTAGGGPSWGHAVREFEIYN